MDTLCRVMDYGNTISEAQSDDFTFILPFVLMVRVTFSMTCTIMAVCVALKCV